MPRNSVHASKFNSTQSESQAPDYPDDEIVSFRLRLDELVRERFGSVSSFLATTGYKSSSYYGWTKGPGFPEMTKLFEIAKFLGVPVREFFLDPGAPSEDTAQRAMLALRELKEKAAQAEAELAKALGISAAPAPRQKIDTTGMSTEESDLARRLDATRPEPGKRKKK